MTDFSKFKVRCSAISKVLSNSKANPCLTEKQELQLKELEKKTSLTDKQQEEFARLLMLQENGKKIVLSATCIDYLMEAYAWEVAKKKSAREFMDIPQIAKGKMAEEDSIQLLSQHQKKFFTKNADQVSNEFLTGEYDLCEMDEGCITDIWDIKTVWDYPGFLRRMNIGLDDGHREQVAGYCDITGAKRGRVAYCLVDLPEPMQNDMKKKLFYSGNYISEESPAFLEKWSEVLHSFTFSDIPIHQRVHITEVELFTEYEKSKLYDRVKICREWLCNFHVKYQSVTN